jgi:predicted nicotinamide N-methyase
MRAAADDAKVQKLACDAIEDAATVCSSMVVDLGAVSAVFNCMAAHTGSAAVQAAGLAALCNIALDDDGQTDVARDGGVAVAVQAMSLHSEFGPVQVRSTTLMHRIACICFFN